MRFDFVTAGNVLTNKGNAEFLRNVIFIGALACTEYLKFATVCWNVYIIFPSTLSEDRSYLVCYVIFVDKYLRTL
jgi:hypothetical protein